MIQETAWLDDTPIALLTGTSTIQYIHADHLNTPRVITNTAGTILWWWNADAFGDYTANEDVDGNGQLVKYNPRFPGQYYDVTVKSNYNYFRDYDPMTGRYLQSDPIGLAGGLNTYLYANANPLRFTDPTGEKVGGAGGKDSIAALLRAPPKPADPSFVPEPSNDSGKNNKVCLGGDDCAHYRALCRIKCSDAALPTKDYGTSYFRCLNECYERYGCL